MILSLIEIQNRERKTRRRRRRRKRMEEGYQWINPSPEDEFNVKNYRDVSHVGSFGCYGKKAGQFLDPLGISSADDFLCVTDPMRNVVSIFDHRNTFVEEISENDEQSVTNDILSTSPMSYNSLEERHLSSVFDVSVHEPSRTILVTDPVRKCIHSMNKQGDLNSMLFEHTIELPKSDTLSGLCVTNEGKIYVADSEAGSILLCNQTGDILSRFGQEGIENGELCFPQFLCFDGRNDRLLVSDTANSRIQIFSAEGRFLHSFGSYGTENNCFKYPSGITIDDHGRIFVVDQGLHNVKVFDRSGDWLHTLGKPGVKPGCFHSPKGLTILQTGDLFITDSLNCRVQHFA